MANGITSLRQTLYKSPCYLFTTPKATLKRWAVGEYAAAPFPERRDDKANRVDRWGGRWFGRLSLALSPLRRIGLRRFAGEVDTLGAGLVDIDEAALRQRSDRLRARIAQDGLTRPLAAESFALVREVSTRLLGLRHYPVQIMGGYAMLKGSLVEMATGEGKTLTAALPAVTVALAGLPVHVVTVNEYLAKRDADYLTPVYAFFGLAVGWLEPGQDPASRQEMYGRDITYCINKDLVFDYLRDRLNPGLRSGAARAAVRSLFDPGHGPGRSVLRGLYFAIVDEADSILVDEARTPLIISHDRQNGLPVLDYQAALSFAAALAPEDYRITPAERSARLSASGRTVLERDSVGMSGLWRFKKAREEMVEQALAALHLYELDLHYMVVEGKVQIVDEFTGRTMADRSWERGLHQLIEIKEGLEPTSQRETIARITYQRFFRRYLRLSGMTGTAAEVAPELRAVFGLDTIAVPTHRPLLRRDLGEKIFVSAERRWQAVAERIGTLREAGRAVLVGTRSVEASELLSGLLGRQGIEHTVLNARQNAEEAQIIAEAGQPGRVTVATNMAGRGTDILLHPEVRTAGGLHVILTEFHESRRIDRQLYGRAGRQGDPGSFESLVSLEDELFRAFAGFWAGRLKRPWPGGVLPSPVGRLLRRHAQAAAERLHARIRKRTLEADKHLDKSLAFSGRGE